MERSTVATTNPKRERFGSVESTMLESRPDVSEVAAGALILILVLERTYTSLLPIAHLLVVYECSTSCAVGKQITIIPVFGFCASQHSLKALYEFVNRLRL